MMIIPIANAQVNKAICDPLLRQEPRVTGSGVGDREKGKKGGGRGGTP